VDTQELEFPKESWFLRDKQEVQSICHTEESPERCTRQSALIAAKSVKFRSSLIPADQFTAKNVGRREEAHAEEDTNIKTKS